MINLLRELFVPCKENDFKPRILRTQVFFMLLGLLVGIKILTLVSFWDNFGATIFNQVSQEDLYELTNQARTENGAVELKVSSRLEAVAQLKLSDMLQNNYFAHISPVGIEPWHWFDKANYDYRVAGENLAMSFMSSNEVLSAWLNSETHRKNLLLNDFKEVGIAVGLGMINGQQTIVVVQEFGTPLTVSVLAIKNTKPIVTPLSIPKLTPKPSLTPRPIIKTDPISLKKALAIVPQVKSSVSEKSFLPEYLSYFANDSFKKIMILFVAIAVLILFLKIFVAFHVQFPALIFRAIILIAISLSFVLIKDESFLSSKIQITDRAEIIIFNGK